MDSFFLKNWGTMLFCVWRVLGIAIVVRLFGCFLLRIQLLCHEFTNATGPCLRVAKND